MVARIDAASSRELQAVILSMKVLPREVAKLIRSQTKRLGQPEWQSAVQAHARTTLDNRVLSATATISPSDQNVRLASAAKGRALSGGFLPSRDFAGVEFGANRDAKTTYTATSRKGKRYTVTRRTQRQLPPRVRNGRVFYPAAADFIPRIAALWSQTVVRAVHDVFEGK